MTTPTPEAIEAAARAINEKHDFPAPLWESLVNSKDRANQHRVMRDRAYATAALTAAYPIIAAQAKAEALREAAADLNSQLREYRLGAHEVLTQKIKPSGGDDTRSLQLALVAAKHTESWLLARAEIIEGKSE